MAENNIKLLIHYDKYYGGDYIPTRCFIQEHLEKLQPINIE